MLFIYKDEKCHLVAVFQSFQRPVDSLQHAELMLVLLEDSESVGFLLIELFFFFLLQSCKGEIFKNPCPFTCSPIYLFGND